MTDATGYSRTQITLHWLTAALVASQFLFHDWVSAAFERGLETGSMAVTPGAAVHLGGGMLVLGIVIFRLYLRNAEGVPPPPDAEPGWARLASKLAHWGFYAVLLLLPVTGAAAWAQKSEAAAEVHELLRGVLLVLIVAHVGAVIVHHVVWKTGLLSRMTRPSS